MVGGREEAEEEGEVVVEEEEDLSSVRSSVCRGSGEVGDGGE